MDLKNTLSILSTLSTLKTECLIVPNPKVSVKRNPLRTLSSLSMGNFHLHFHLPSSSSSLHHLLSIFISILKWRAADFPQISFVAGVKTMKRVELSLCLNHLFPKTTEFWGYIYPIWRGKSACKAHTPIFYRHQENSKLRNVLALMHICQPQKSFSKVLVPEVLVP